AAGARLRGGVAEVLGRLAAQAGETAGLVDDLDLPVAGGLEDAVDLVLLLLGRSGTAAGARSSGDDGGRGGGLDVELLLELLDELGELEQGHLLEGAEELFGAELRHGCDLSFCANTRAARRRAEPCGSGAPAPARIVVFLGLVRLLLVRRLGEPRELGRESLERGGGLALLGLEGAGHLREENLAG